MIVDWASTGMAKPGEQVSGDAYLVRTFSPAGALLAVIDGLGHGAEAAAAAQRARTALEEFSPDSVIALTRHCHEALAGTRGACLSLATFNARDHTMTWMGVGNVEAMLVRAQNAEREYLLLRAGVVGHHLPQLQATMLAVHAGDVLFMYTDGIRFQYADAIDYLEIPPSRLAQNMLQRYLHIRQSDDALVLAARYVGEG